MSPPAVGAVKVGQTGVTVAVQEQTVTVSGADGVQLSVDAGDAEQIAQALRLAGEALHDPPRTPSFALELDRLLTGFGWTVQHAGDGNARYSKGGWKQLTAAMAVTAELSRR